MIGSGRRIKTGVPYHYVGNLLFMIFISSVLVILGRLEMEPMFVWQKNHGLDVVTGIFCCYIYFCILNKMVFLIYKVLEIIVCHRLEGRDGDPHYLWDLLEMIDLCAMSI